MRLVLNLGFIPVSLGTIFILPVPAQASSPSPDVSQSSSHTGEHALMSRAHNKVFTSAAPKNNTSDDYIPPDRGSPSRTEGSGTR